MKNLIVTIMALFLSSCVNYIENTRLENIQAHKNQCLQTGLQEGTNALSQCVTISNYRAQIAEKSKPSDMNDYLTHQRQLEMIQRLKYTSLSN